MGASSTHAGIIKSCADLIIKYPGQCVRSGMLAWISPRIGIRVRVMINIGVMLGLMVGLWLGLQLEFNFELK